MLLQIAALINDPTSPPELPLHPPDRASHAQTHPEGLTEPTFSASKFINTEILLGSPLYCQSSLA